MRRLFFCCVWILISFLYSFPTTASLIFHDDISFVKINPNPKLGSKPAYFRYASVSLLTDDNDLTFKPVETLDVKTRCQMSGYYMTKASCTSAGKRYGPRCSDDGLWRTIYL